MRNWLGDIDKYLKYLQNIKSASPHTLRSYKNDLSRVFEKASDKLTEREFLSYIRTQQSTWSHLSPATRNRKAASLKSFFNWLYETGEINKEISPHINCPKVPVKIPHFISADEAIGVLKSYPAQMTMTELQDKTLFCLLYGSGLRISEACQLNWKNVDFQARRILITRKGQKDQWVPIPQLTAVVLKNLKKMESGDFVFGENPLHTRVAYEIIRQRGVKAKLLKPLHPHALRHSFATHLLTSGADLRSLQELLGHQSLAATQKYTHISTHEIARMLDNHHPLEVGPLKSGKRRGVLLKKY